MIFGDEVSILSESLKPPKISEWVEKHRVLGPPAQEKGPMRLSRTPYFRPLLDMAGDRRIERIVLCKSAQIAGTEFALSVGGYYAVIYACPVMFVLADEDTATYINKERIQRMFKSSPTLKQLLTADITSRDITLTNGATITIGWASSVARIASRPIQVVILDEVDKPGYYRSSDEGDAISLAIQRTETFLGRKIIILSTPTIESGNIWRELNMCDVIYDWHVPCPRCGTYQPLVWSPEHTLSFSGGVFRSEDGKMLPLGRVVWEGGREATSAEIESAAYECGICKEKWGNTQKNVAIQHGKLVPRASIEKASSIGFHVNRLYSLLGESGNISKLVREWILAVKSGSQKKMQAFTNNVLGEPYRYIKAERNYQMLMDRKDHRPSGVVPSDAITLTAGVDVQDAGFFYIIRAWGHEMTSWLVRYGFVDRWEALENIMFNSTYKDPSGYGHQVRLVFVDSGGHRTAEVYQWCRKWKNIAYPVKGHDTLYGRPLKPSKIDVYPDGRSMKGGLTLYHIDTSYFKDQLDAKLSISVGDPGAFYFNADAKEDYFDQLTSEGRNEDGRWVVLGRRQNHYLDAEIYAMAAATALGLERISGSVNQNLEDGGEESRPELPSTKRLKTVRSRWLAFF